MYEKGDKVSLLHTLLNLRELRKNQWKKPEELEEIQNRKLRAIVKYSYENVEFYHRRLDVLGLKPDDIKTTDDLRKLPITTRSDIQKNSPTGFTARSLHTVRFEKHTSSGSTGIPITVLSDARAEAYRAALFARSFFECGLHIRDKMIRITSTPQPKPKWHEGFGFMRRIILDPKDSVESGLRMLEKDKPDAIFGQSSYIWQLANEISKTNKHPDPMLVFTTADIISKKMRNLVREVFGDKVFDFYGCVEVERVAWECPEHEAYHMDIDSQVIEFVDVNEPVAPGERGQILLTCLYNYAMPLIRYDVGDFGKPTAEICSCGRGLPMMSDLEGRVNDFVKRPDGSMISPMTLLYIDEIPGISQFLIVQKRRDKLSVELVLDGTNPEETVQKSRAYLKEVVGEDMTVDIAIVKEIPRERSGKMRVVKSLV